MSRYLSAEIEQKINELVNDKDSELIMKTMIKEYSKDSLTKAQDLLSYINDVASNIINISSKQIQELSQSSWMLIFQTEMDKNDVHSYFATMVPVCKTLFPDGEMTNANFAQKRYFEKFIKLCENKKAFSWDNKSDVQWAKTYGYIDYLKMIWNSYIRKETNNGK